MLDARVSGSLPRYIRIREKVLATLGAFPVRRHGCLHMRKKVSNKDVKVVETITFLYTYGKIWSKATRKKRNHLEIMENLISVISVKHVPEDNAFSEQ